MQTFNEVLQWLTAGGSVAVAAWFVSWLLEDFTWWQALPSASKKLLILAASLLIGVGAQALILHPAALTALRPYLDTAVLVIVAWLATQAAHKADKDGKGTPGGELR